MNDRSLPLDQPLPAEVLRGGGGLVAYRNYPVFSWPWLRKRTFLFALCMGSYAAFRALVAYLGNQRLAPALAIFALATLGGLAMASGGPFLATVVRHRRWPLRRERRLVVAALVAGLVISFVADKLVSDSLERGMPANAAVMPPPEAREEVFAKQPLALVVNLALLAAIYTLLGGGLALRSYLGEPARMAELGRQRELAELRAEKQRLDLRLGTLQAQVEPHFLFNTLSSLRSLIRRDAATAESMLDALVDYLRATIPKLRDDAPGSTLGQQLEICASYLRVMAARMGGRLQHAVEVEASLRATSFPPLLLITLVENAIKHGIEPRPGPGRVVIRAERRPAEGSLAVSVIDDGVGLRPGLGGGVGLANVRGQLRTRYGEHASLTLTGPPGGGATATIVLPLAP